jgi:hypothetical protein
MRLALTNYFSGEYFAMRFALPVLLGPLHRFMEGVATDATGLAHKK